MVIFVPTDLETVARTAAPWARVIRPGLLGYWCADSELALQAALRD
jgi:hypothetical protein